MKELDNQLAEQLQTALDNHRVPTVDVFIVNEDRKVLVMQRAASKKLFPLCWEPPGGHVEEGETVSDAAKRELEQETDLLLTKITGLIRTIEWVSDSGTLYTTFALLGEADGEAIIKEPESAIDMRWIDATQGVLLLEHRQPGDTVHFDTFNQLLAQ